ncbi:MAG: SDR family NAD(P)-dependent oxidoreductase [Ilumatobacteraceae bacterium]|nr:SDR family NAD(P)-dependent oxidoreductase [Ilumatobacteraceae bacterium]
MGLLDGKVAIVTGAAHGIGRGHALELAKEGAKVVVNDLGCSVDGADSSMDADLTVGLIEEAGGTAVANYEDVADFDGAGRMVEQAIDAYGKLDILVNNAGIARDTMIFNMTEEAWDSVIRVHLKGTFAPTHHAAKYWRAETKADRPVAGRVINTTSGAGVFGNAGQANYATAKAGLIGFTQTVSVELRRLGVTVNCISPTGTTRIAATIPTAGIPIKEPNEYTEFDLMDPSSSAPLVAWLSSDKAAHITGQVIRAYGDRLARILPLSYGPEVNNGDKRWTPEAAGARVDMDLFGVVTPGLRY